MHALDVAKQLKIHSNLTKCDSHLRKVNCGNTNVIVIMSPRGMVIIIIHLKLKGKR